MFPAKAATVTVGWGVGLAGLGVSVARGVELGTGVTVAPINTGVGVEFSRPIWNVPRQAVLARKKTTAEIKMRDFIGAS
jgi:hypothetical protein